MKVTSPRRHNGKSIGRHCEGERQHRREHYAGYLLGLSPSPSAHRFLLSPWSLRRTPEAVRPYRQMTRGQVVRLGLRQPATPAGRTARLANELSPCHPANAKTAAAIGQIVFLPGDCGRFPACPLFYRPLHAPVPERPAPAGPCHAACVKRCARWLWLHVCRAGFAIASADRTRQCRIDVFASRRSSGSRH